METLEKTVETLNDLIEINNSRTEGFEKAIADLGEGDADLKSLFQEYAQQSRKNTQELTAAIAATGHDYEKGGTASGAIHRAWIDVKALFTGNDRAAILSECERGEDAIKKAYETALTEGELAGEASTIVSSQAQDIRAAHDRIKLLRDSAK
ncbi:ferritin-like domain-containing protein [Mucilaginibacter sp. KACC 22063]|uniref:ferritin-like domain-containing protein n=1 Tax=Mucilaginibacter sp. KACC 22063 TaxID=3025666 RepID=UPI0023664030|nr:PA2169 family four-helix-bundle protein [Mucilaginibacter sp. KACC 22063]WDF55955.1 PA2169 family four-helix-bundle protein [Mucilaginibacter sp. KACC 22063]